MKNQRTKLTAFVCAGVLMSLTACKQEREGVVVRNGEMPKTAENAETVGKPVAKSRQMIISGKAPKIVNKINVLEINNVLLPTLYGDQVIDRQRIGYTLDDLTDYAINNQPMAEILVQEEAYLSVLRDIKTFTNTQGEERYLVMIEKFKLVDEDADGVFELPLSGHAATAGAELLLFKPLSDGEFELISQYHNDEMVGAWGRAAIFNDDVLSDFKQIGKETMGLFYDFSFTGAGGAEYYQFVLMISDDRMAEVKVATTGASNENWVDAEDPTVLSYDYEGKLVKVDDSQPALPYYPIEIRFSGTNLEYDKNSDSSRLVDMNKTVIYRYDGQGDEYLASGQ